MNLAPVNKNAILRQERAFTLIELLIVVAIIAVLASLSVGVYGKVMNTMRDKEAQKTCVDIAAAIQNYYSDYDMLPETGAGDDWEGDSKTGEWVGVLSDIGQQGDASKNPKHRKYFEGMKQARNRKGKMSGGIDYDTDPAKPAILDPYGKEFKIRMDTNFDGDIENPDTKNNSTKKYLKGPKALVWGAGKDENFETWEDNVKSWD